MSPSVGMPADLTVMSDGAVEVPLIELPATLTPGEVDELVDVVNTSIANMREALPRLFHGRAWVAAGLPDWDTFCSARFGGISFPRVDRAELVLELTAEGMSTRAIGSALGVDQATVVRDRGDANASPAPVTGIDGKTYAPRPPKPPLSPERQAIAADRAHSSQVYAVQHALMSHAVTELINNASLIADDDYPDIQGLDLEAATIDRLRQLRDAVDTALTAMTTKPALRRIK
jgi:hypothetical protein